MRLAALGLLLVAGCAARPLDYDAPPVGGNGGGRAGSGGGQANVDLARPAFDFAIAHDAGSHDGGVLADAGDHDGGISDGGAADGGLFAPPIGEPAPMGYQPLAVAVADITGDGRADIVVVASLGQATAVIVYAQTASGGLAAPILYPAGNDTPNAAMMAVADFDGDGRLDVAFTGYEDIRLLLQTPAGGFGAARVLFPSHTFEDAELLVAGDFDGDGRADLLWAGWDSPSFDVFYQAENFAAPRSVGCPHAGFDSIATADFNGDGTLDVAISSLETPTLCRVDRLPGGGFSAGVTTPLSESPPIRYIAAGDIDGDGRPDLVALGGIDIDVQSRYVATLRQIGDGSFLETGLSTPDWYPSGILIADVDGDGLGDVVVSHFMQLEVGVMRRLPGGGLAAEELYPYSSASLDIEGPQLTAVGDVNGDGKPDLVDLGDRVWVLYHH